MYYLISSNYRGGEWVLLFGTFIKKGARKKMKKVVCILLVACITGTAFASDSESEYNRKRLIIQYYSGVKGAWTELAGGFSSYSDWKYFQGFREITETEFLEIAGYHEEAEQLANNQNMGTFWLVSAIGLLTIGLIGALSSENTEGLDSKETIGLVAASLSIPTALMYSKYYGHQMPLEQAYAIQEEYNRKLRKSLQEKS